MSAIEITFLSIGIYVLSVLVWFFSYLIFYLNQPDKEYNVKHPVTIGDVCDFADDSIVGGLIPVINTLFAVILLLHWVITSIRFSLTKLCDIVIIK